jgi:hypothetical protein
MTETTKITDWLDEEIKNISPAPAEYEKLEALKLETGKVFSFIVDFSKPFAKWENKANGIIKAIIPVEHKGVKKVLWLNVKNPLYREICERGKKGITKFNVSVSGSQKDTKYNLVEIDEV